MADVDVAKIKEFDTSLILCVFGYTRKCREVSFPTDIPYYDIPELVNFIILYYYYMAETLRCNTKHATNISSDGTILQIEKAESNIFGSIDIEADGDFLFSWTFKIICSKSCIYIGIIDAAIENEIPSGHFFIEMDQSDDKRFYGAEGDFKWCHLHDILEYDEEWRGSDIVKMELNTKQKTIRYYKGDQDQGIAFEDIDFSNDVKYHLAVTCYHKGESLKLIDFKQIVLS